MQERRRPSRKLPCYECTMSCCDYGADTIGTARLLRAHARLVHEALDLVVDGAAHPPARCVDVELVRLLPGDGRGGRRQRNLVMNRPLMVGNHELWVEDAVELEEAADEVRLSAHQEPTG